MDANEAWEFLGRMRIYLHFKSIDSVLNMTTPEYLKRLPEFVTGHKTSSKQQERSNLWRVQFRKWKKEGLVL